MYSASAQSPIVSVLDFASLFCDVILKATCKVLAISFILQYGTNLFVINIFNICNNSSGIPASLHAM